MGLSEHGTVVSYYSGADPGFPRGDAKLLFSHIFPENCKKIGPRAGADPGFLVGGGANIQICQIFPKNCMKQECIPVGCVPAAR